MGLKIIDDNAVEADEGEFSLNAGTIEKNELNVKAQGGTEMMQKELALRVPAELLSKFQIIPSRVRDVDPNKIPILWCHDTWDDPESAHLSDKGWKKFERIVFVSHHQKDSYMLAHGIPPSKCVVLQNAINPIEQHEKPDDGVINLIYHTTPHRGLELLYPVYEKIYEKFGDKVHLDVYSSFEAYGWPQRDEPYQELFKAMEAHEGITYHGFQPNNVVRAALKKAHIFAYPSIWPETSCIAAIEAMSAGCLVVTSSLGALPETCANFAFMYNYNEDVQIHAQMFAGMLNNAIENVMNPEVQQTLFNQKAYTDLFYDWRMRAMQWEGLLKGLTQ